MEGCSIGVTICRLAPFMCALLLDAPARDTLSDALLKKTASRRGGETGMDGLGGVRAGGAGRVGCGLSLVGASKNWRGVGAGAGVVRARARQRSGSGEHMATGLVVGASTDEPVGPVGANLDQLKTHPLPFPWPIYRSPREPAFPLDGRHHHHRDP